jgi:hypothetical protein
MNDLNDPPAPPLQHAVVASELVDFLRAQGVGEKVVRIATGLLDTAYLTSLRPPSGTEEFQDPGALRGNQLRYIFRRHLATLLLWGERHPEGVLDGFPDSLNDALRGTVYPDK